MNRVVIASNNPGKLREIRRLLAPLDIEALPQAEFGVPECDEPHGTFIENALVKARHASRLCALPALADDSGVCVHALGGAPGVHSARYADATGGGRDDQDRRNNDKLLHALEHETDRRAHYYCVIVLLRSAADPQPLIGEGEWYGEIARAPRGSGGFGYDPLFLIPELGRTGAELALDEKSRLSHRGKALAALIARLRGDRQ